MYIPARFSKKVGVSVKALQWDHIGVLPAKRTITEELVQDLITITHGFSIRLEGLRNYRKVLEKAIADDQSAQDQAASDS